MRSSGAGALSGRVPAKQFRWENASDEREVVVMPLLCELSEYGCMFSYRSCPVKYWPFALSLSKSFDKLNANGTQGFTGPDQ